MWGLDKLISSNYSATWIPEKVPTLILGSEFDWMTPFELFENDPRFLRDNITFCKVKEAGHFSWADNPSGVKAAFEKFLTKLKGIP
jgi:pimeloyl-ACP methyl ester carboxylesterase